MILLYGKYTVFVLLLYVAATRAEFQTKNVENIQNEEK